MEATRSLANSGSLRVTQGIMRDVGATPSEYKLPVTVPIAYFIKQYVTYGILYATDNSADSSDSSITGVIDSISECSALQSITTEVFVGTVSS